MIDVHCHILPGIDDGARDLGVSLEMARVAVAAGTAGIVCTPHHLNGVFSNTRASVLAAVNAFRGALSDREIKLDLYPGSELHLVPELPGLLESGDALTINDGGRYVLVELPTRIVPMGTEVILRSLLGAGITPVIVHPERNSELRRKPERASQWVAMGCKLQLTGQSCTGEFGLPIKAICSHWLGRGEVHLVASDAHRPQGRAPRLDQARAALVQSMGLAAARGLLEENPRRLVAGEDLAKITPAPDHGNKASFLARIFGRYVQ
jgi:protein-tyrosine phosphatase